MAEPISTTEPLLFHAGHVQQSARVGSAYTSSNDVHHVDQTQQDVTRIPPTKRFAGGGGLAIASSANRFNINGKHGCRRDSDMATKLTEELSKENASLRSRLKGINVLSTLLSEAREEIANLNAQKNKQEIAAENLQSRLHRLGADSSDDLADHEIFMPGHDKQFMKSLISENMRLQKALENGNKDATTGVKDEQQAERIKKLETIIQQLTQQRREKEKKIQELQELMKSSSEEKDLELVRLREAVEKSTKAQENAEAICESLTDQAEQLREQVKAASQKATEESSKQQKDQDERQKESDKLEQQVKKLKRTASNLKPEEQQVDQLEKENARLTEQLKEVIGMNTRWQQYNDQREAYVIKLSKSSYQQQSKITVYEQQISDLTKSNEELKKENEQLKQEDQDKRDAALCSADQQLAIEDEEIQELKEQVKDMKDLVEAVSSQHRSTFDDIERIQVLEQQVTTFASDFKGERRDRERIQGLYTDALKALKEKDRYSQDLQFRQRAPVTPVAAYGAPQYTRYNRQSSTCRIAFQPSSTAKVRQPSSAIGAAEYSPHGSKARSLVSNANGRSPMQAPDMDRQQYYMYGEEFLDIPGDEGIDGGAPRGAYGGPRYSPYNRQSRVTTFASDFQDERRDRESFQGLYTHALKELQEKDRYIEDLQRQVRQRSPVTPVAAYGVPQYTPYNRQSSNFRQDLVAQGMDRQQYYDEIDGCAPRANDMPDGFIDVGNTEEGGDEPLKCPHCFRGFRVSEVEKYMQHTTACLENN